MKCLAILMAIFFFSMAVVPCTDGTTCKEEASLSHDHSHDGEEDHCTPLCACSCCGLSFMLPLLDELELYEKQASYVYDFAYSKDYSFSYSNNTWHPPTNS